MIKNGLSDSIHSTLLIIHCSFTYQAVSGELMNETSVLPLHRVSLRAENINTGSVRFTGIHLLFLNSFR